MEVVPPCTGGLLPINERKKKHSKTQSSAASILPKSSKISKCYKPAPSHRDMQSRSVLCFQRTHSRAPAIIWKPHIVLLVKTEGLQRASLPRCPSTFPFRPLTSSFPSDPSPSPCLGWLLRRGSWRLTACTASPGSRPHREVSPEKVPTTSRRSALCAGSPRLLWVDAVQRTKKVVGPRASARLTPAKILCRQRFDRNRLPPERSEPVLLPHGSGADNPRPLLKTKPPSLRPGSW